MAFQLPDGTLIRAPRRGRSFVIDGVRHPEKCLESGGFCSAWGITWVPDTKPERKINWENEREKRLTTLNTDLQAYLAAHYDLGTQMSFQSIYVLPTTPTAMKLMLEQAWNWIQSVMTYYYSTKGAILIEEDAETACGIEWDYSQFNELDPGISLKDLLAG